MSRNIAIELIKHPDHQYKQGDTIDIVMNVASPRNLSKTTINLVMKDNSGNIHTIEQVKKISLSPIKPSEIIFKSNLQIAVGTYQLGIQLVTENETIETAILLGNNIEVKQ